MKIGVLGAGRIGAGVGVRLLRAGHHVLFSARDLEHLASLVKTLGSGADLGDVEEAATFGEVVLLAVPYLETASVLARVADFGDRVLVDARNPYDASFQAIALRAGTAGGEIQAARPDARVVKAFNTIPSATLARSSRAIASPFSGDDAAACALVARLIQDVGFTPIDLGALANARLQEPGGALYGKEQSIVDARRLMAASAEVVRNGAP